MDCLVRLFYGGRVRKEDGVLEYMEEELEMFEEPPSFSALLSRVQEKFVGDFTLRGRFDCGKTRAHYVLMPLRNEGHWLRYTRVLQESNVTMAEVVVENGKRVKSRSRKKVVENGYRKAGVEDGPSFDGVVGDGNQLGDAAPGSPVADSRRVSGGCINDDFNVGRLVRDVPAPTEVEHAGEQGTSMAVLAPLGVVRSRSGITLQEGHHISSGECSGSLVNQKRKRTCGKRSTNTDTPPAAEPIPELSDEIVLDILVWLPVKSLLRCKSVCKGWRAIITDPFFVRSHLQHSASRCEQDPCLLIGAQTLGRRVFSNHIRFYQWQQGASMATLMHNKDFGSEFGSIHSFAQCDGLVLVPTDTGLYLCNPATRETITLPDRDSNRHRSSTRKCLCCTGLGLDPRTGKHKVVRAFYRSIDPETGKGRDMGMEVFTVSGNNNGSSSAWREIKDDLPYPAGNWNTGKAVNGFLFWRLAITSNHGEIPCPWGLLRLSLADETFGIIRLPDFVCPDGFELDVLHGELCVSAYISEDAVTMWLLPIQEDGGQEQTWEQRYTFHLNCLHYPLAFLPGGRMMLYAYPDYKICLYDLSTAKLTTVCQLKRMKYQGRTASTWRNIFDFHVHLYTESLVRISL